MKISTVHASLGTTILTVAALALGAGTTACSSSSTSAATSGAGTDAGSAQEDAGNGTGTGSDAGSGVDAATPTADAGVDAGPGRPAAAFFRGTLAGTVDQSKAMSDPFFNGVKDEAIGAGDNGHDALLGTTHLGTTLNQFVGLDTWSGDANMDAVYSNPMVKSFAMSFYAAPPEFKTFYYSDFHQWGDTDSGDTATPHYFVMIRGKYAGAPSTIKSAHDTYATGDEAALKAAGNVAHVVFTGRTDETDALIVDIWTSDTNIDATYSDATRKAAIAALFDATGPNYGVYGSTDWVTW
jgi:hypothetical protein